MDAGQSCSIQNNGDQTKTVTVDLLVFSLLTIKKAAYKFTNECSFSFNQVSPEKLEVTLRFNAQADQEQIAAAFLNEIVDQDLRELIAMQTATTRNLILAHAFSKTSLVDPK